jgi:hypothetical protein
MKRALLTAAIVATGIATSHAATLAAVCQRGIVHLRRAIRVRRLSSNGQAWVAMDPTIGFLNMGNLLQYALAFLSGCADRCCRRVWGRCRYRDGRCPDSVQGFHSAVRHITDRWIGETYLKRRHGYSRFVAMIDRCPRGIKERSIDLPKSNSTGDSCQVRSDSDAARWIDDFDRIAAAQMQ